MHWQFSTRIQINLPLIILFPQALLNTLSKFSHSAFIIQEMQRQSVFEFPRRIAGILIALVAVWAVCLVCLRLWLLSKQKTD
jgi:hypothetical protein